MAKKNRTICQLEDNIQDAFTWRRKELLNYKINLHKAKGKWKETLLRAGIPLIYAHWEGFVKEISEYYLEYVSHQKLNLNQLKSTFIAMCVRSKYDLIESNKHTKRSISIDFLLEELGKRAYIPTLNQIDTGSNLNFERFNEICFLISIDSQKYSLSSKLIDSHLLNNRNTIAHGNYLNISEDDFIDLYDKITTILENFKTDVLISARNGSYKR